ncbi:MAG: 5'-methylthioadenosine/S-adenosylhomocysteine nucleosidase, partial [Firmicutes bacterium]|nr:5'-methylthioadenosine/S-adenosylhomocysteine nucleosidase [Bacillota bacterium]
PQALASDMEGCAAAQIAYTFDTPFLNLRSISDIAGQKAAQSFDDNLDLASNRAVQFCQSLLQKLI